MKKPTSVIARAAIAASLTSVFAVTAQADSTATEIAELKARLAALEQQQKQQQTQQTQASASPLATIAESISFGGLIEIEGFYTDNEALDNNASDKSASDLTVATVELGLQASITDNVAVTLTALYEEDDTDLEIDVATVQISDVAGMDFTLGQDYLPFGAFATHLVNDTLALEIAETRETMAMATLGDDSLSASVYVFNGDVDDGNDTLENYGISLAAASDNFALGLDYISNIADSDGISEALAPITDLSETPDAWAAHASVNTGPVLLMAEYLKASKFKQAEWGSAADGKAYQPEAWQLEAGLELGSDWYAAAAWQQTEGVSGLLPETRTSLGVGRHIGEHISVALEYWNDQDYSESDGGSGEDANSLVAQLAVVF